MPRKKTVSTSPIPLQAVDTSDLTFEEAITHVKNGMKITKREWNNPEYFGILSKGFLMLHKPDGKFYQWLVSDGDLFGDDWVVI